MKNVNLRSAAERVLSRLKAMTSDELMAALDDCGDGPVSYAMTASQSYLFSCQQISAFFVNARFSIKNLPDAEHTLSLAGNCETEDAANDALYSLAA